MKLGQRGFTYVEMALVVFILATVGGAATSATFQVLKSSERYNNHMTAVRQVQNTGYRIARDARMAQTIDTDNLTPPNFLELNWTKAETGDHYQVIYTLESVPGSSLKRLFRSQSVNGGPADTAFVAHYLEADAAKTRCEFSGGRLTLTVTATVGAGIAQKSEGRTYKFVPRPG